MSDLMNTYLLDCSPYISSLNYDINKRVVLLECVRNIETCEPHTRVIFEGIRSYSEETIDDEYDDQCMDSVFGLNWVTEGVLCIRTEKKEIIIELENNPRVEILA